MKIEKKLWLALIAFGVFAVAFSGWIFARSTDRESLAFDNTVRLETEEKTEDDIKTQNLVLPEVFDIPRALLFKTTHTAVEILLDGELIYQYGNEANAPKFMKSPGSCWHIVDIPQNSAGKTLVVRLLPTYPGYYGNEMVLFLGTRGDCILKILSNSLPIFIISCGILFAGLISVLLYFATLKNKREQKTEGKNEIFLNLGIFSLLIALWSLQQCGFMQFLIPDGRTLYFVDFFTFFLFPVPFNFLVYDICQSKYRKAALCFPMFYLLNMAVAVLLQCIGIVDIFQILPATHVLIAGNVIYTFALIHYEAKVENNIEAKEFRYPLYIILSFGVAEMILYYVRQFQTTSIFLPLGTLGFIIALCWLQVSRYYDQYIQEQRLLYLQKIANTDMLTNVMNRNAYERTIQQLEEQAAQLQETGVVLFDLDNLKVINDTFGHEKGDEALRLCSQCIRQIFKEEENCFRIGGDEFAYVYHQDEKYLIADRIKRLYILLEEAAKKVTYPLSVSAGYAYYLPDEDNTFQDIVKRSDIMLYRCKRRKKLNHASQNPAASDLENCMPEENLTAEGARKLFLEKEYRDILPEELCRIIDLISPSTDDYLYMIDFRTDFYYIAPQALERFCIGENAFHNVMENYKEFVYRKDYPLLEAEFEELLSTDRCFHNMEYRWLDLKRKPVWVNCRGYIVRDENKKPLYIAGCINEIGMRQKADNISGLLGETGLKEYLKKLEPPFESGYLLRLGIDHFKEINEKQGWEYGDLVLRETAACISECMSENQTVYRLFSDEFMILDRSSKNVMEIKLLYDRVRDAIDQFIKDNDYVVMFTVSGGILPLHAMDEVGYSDAMKLTDFSLNEAKTRGRNRCYVFKEKEYQQFLRKSELIQELRNAVINDFKGFTAFYQPVFKSETGKLYGAEALMRFTSEKFGIVSPVEFIPILEETGLIIPAGRWMMEEAMEKCSQIRKLFSEFRISINISQAQIAKSDAILDVIAALEKAKLPTDALIVELTESDLLEQNINEKHFLTELKRMNIKLALDDFGTGYSNFHYLSELGPAIIKIDRSFTASAVADEGEYYLLNQFCSMIHNLGLKLCIEGVENEAEWAKIQKLRPDFSQGFFWGRPCPYEEFVKTFVEK